MARVLEQIIAIKLSRIVKDGSTDNDVVSEEQMTALVENIPQLVESVLDNPTIVAEVMELE